MKINSWKKEMNGGTLKLDKKNTKIIILNIMLIWDIFDKKTICRECVIWYNVPTVQNMMHEIISWVKNTKTQAVFLIETDIKTIRPEKFIWLIEEKATNPFPSLCVMAQNGARIAPKPRMKNTIMKNQLLIKKFSIRIKPHPPNFNKIPARIILPTVGASTWAFGNQ